MSCICKYIFWNYSRPNSMRLSWDWTWWIWRGAQRAMAVVMGQLRRWPWLYKLSSVPQTLWVLCLFQALLPHPPRCVRILSPTEATEEFKKGFNSPFGEPYTAKSCWLLKVCQKHRLAVHNESSCRCWCPVPWDSPSPEEHGMSLIAHCYFLVSHWTAGCIYIWWWCNLNQSPDVINSIVDT